MNYLFPFICARISAFQSRGRPSLEMVSLYSPGWLPPESLSPAKGDRNLLLADQRRLIMNWLLIHMSTNASICRDESVGLIPLSALLGPYALLMGRILSRGYPGEANWSELQRRWSVPGLHRLPLRGETTEMSSFHMCCKNSQVVSQDQQGHCSCEEM